MPTIVHVGVGIVARRDPLRLLVCQRKLTDYWGGWWEFPGGKCDPGEAIEHCVVRELREELGIQVATRTALPVVEHLYADRDRLVRLHPFICDLVSGEPAALEVEQVQWCQPEHLHSMRFLPANGPMIEAALAELAR